MSLSLLYLTLAKWFTYVGLFALAGVCTLRLAILPRAARREEATDVPHLLSTGLAPLAAWAAVLVGLAALARLLAQTYSVFGLDEPVTFGLVRVIAIDSRWGAHWMPQAGAAALVLAAGVLILVQPRLRVAWWTAAVGASALVVTLPLTGHMAALGGEVGPVVQAVHLLAGGLWLGTLSAILLSGVRAAVRRSDFPAGQSADRWLAHVVDVFSPLAVVAVTTAVLTGVFIAFRFLDSAAQLWTSGYGRMLLLKTALVCGTGAVGLYNWRRLRPRLGGEQGSAELWRTGRLELFVGAGLLLVTAVLVHLPLPGE